MVLTHTELKDSQTNPLKVQKSMVKLMCCLAVGWQPTALTGTSEGYNTGL